MKLTIAAIGKLKAGPEKALVNDYAERITALGKKAGIGTLKIIEWTESQKPDAAPRMAEEEKRLWGAAPQGAYIIALDERGKSHNSVVFAARLRKLLDSGQSDIVFMLGGPDGHSENSRQKANELMALGPMTWPHRLARVMLLEQIYRSVTIMFNHPYHRG